jgi:hypothetical protein
MSDEVHHLRDCSGSPCECGADPARFQPKESDYRPGAVALWNDVLGMGLPRASGVLREVEFVAEQARDSGSYGIDRLFPSCAERLAATPVGTNAWYTYKILDRYAGKTARDILQDLDDLRRLKRDSDAAPKSVT